MKKQLITLTVAALFGAAVYAVAQNAPRSRQTVRLAGGLITVDAGRTQMMGNGTLFLDGIIINVNGVRISANRAFVEVSDLGGATPVDINLVGSCRLSLPKSQ